MNFASTPLPGESLLHIRGPDALAFLQGQATCDTRSLDASSALPGACCTPQGRVICDFLLVQLEADHLALRMRRDILDVAAATLGRYIVFSRAELDAAQDTWQAVACWGSEAAGQVAELCGVRPHRRYEVVSGPGLLAVQVDDEGAQFECYLDRSRHGELPAPLAHGLVQEGEARWRALQIANGIGRVERPTVESFVPQMLNYDLTGHISFSKGCYTGQEVVARLHYRGRSKRRLYLVRFEGPADTPAGTELFTAAGGQSVGSIVNAAAADRGGAVALAVATAEGVAAGLHLGNPEGPSLAVGRLPYPVAAD